MVLLYFKICSKAIDMSHVYLYKVLSKRYENMQHSRTSSWWIYCLLCWAIHLYFDKISGLAFVHANVEKLLREEDGAFPRWFCIVFPAMVELAQTKGLNVLPDGLTDVVASIFHQRERFLEMYLSFPTYTCLQHISICITIYINFVLTLNFISRVVPLDHSILLISHDLYGPGESQQLVWKEG